MKQRQKLAPIENLPSLAAKAFLGAFYRSGLLNRGARRIPV
jgi:hypothetical protein